MAWMDLKDNDIDVVIGPIENYEDGDPTDESPSDEDRRTDFVFDWRGRMARITARAQDDANDQNTYYFFWDTVTADGLLDFLVGLKTRDARIAISREPERAPWEVLR